MVINNEFRKDADSLVEGIEELATAIVLGKSENVEEDAMLIQKACGFLRQHLELDYSGEIEELQEKLEEAEDELNEKEKIISKVADLVT